MKITKFAIITFLTTFLISSILVIFVFFEPTTENSVPTVKMEVNLGKLSTPPSVVKIEPQTAEEIVDWEEEDSRKFKIKLLETGEGYHGDQVKAKSGETWLGLFKENDKYYLRSTKLKITRVQDTIVDDENKMTGKSVFTSYKASSVFLLKNAKMLREDEIDTLFFATDIDETTELKNGTQKEFKFNDENYSLRVENRFSADEFLGKGSKLILARGETTQILNYLKDGCNDCYWNLYWVGDLDKDGKLDFYLDLSWHYNVIDKRLFLSSQADKGKLVKNVAGFWINGC